MITIIVNGLQTSIMQEVERILSRKKDYQQLSDKMKVLVSERSQVFSFINWMKKQQILQKSGIIEPRS